MLTTQQLAAMQTGDTMADGTGDFHVIVEKSKQKNGKEIWIVNGWVTRSAERAASWMRWNETMLLRHGGKR